jgi:hypothetical protein
VSAITDKSGNAGIAYWVNRDLGLRGKDVIDKRHPGISKIRKWVTKVHLQIF